MPPTLPERRRTWEAGEAWTWKPRPHRPRTRRTGEEAGASPSRQKTQPPGQRGYVWRAESLAGAQLAARSSHSGNQKRASPGTHARAVHTSRAPPARACAFDTLGVVPVPGIALTFPRARRRHPTGAPGTIQYRETRPLE